jgi:hypothetical protein
MMTLKELDNIEPGTALDSLRKAQLTDIQRALAFLCYQIGTIDGLYGPRSRRISAKEIRRSSARILSRP